MYHTRHLESKLVKLSKVAKVILILGARQVGKSTILKKLFPNIPHITFDAYQDTYNVRSDPDLFLQQFEGAVIFDEVQYIPELLSAIKRRVDTIDKPGQYFLTGSQSFAVLKNLAESMAGRVAILKLHPMTLHELEGVADQHWLPFLLDTPEDLPALCSKTLTNNKLWRVLWRGGFPGLLNVDDELVPNLLQSYLNTYIERDVRMLETIKDLGEFQRFLAIGAALTSQEINESHIGREIGVSHTTAGRWINLLEVSFLWQLIRPYYGNTIKRISKKRKGVLNDSGLACFLLRISSPEAIGAYPNIGAIFESYVIQQITGASTSLVLSPNLYHWRTNGGAEVDVILERDGWLYPIEVKAKSYLTNQDARGLLAFRETYSKERIKPGIIIYAGDRCYKVNQDTIALPFNALVAPIHKASE